MAETEVVIRVVHGTQWDSKVIEWRTNSEWSHIEACGSCAETFGAMFKGGVRVRRAGDACYKDVTKIEIWHIPCTQDQRDSFWKFLLDQNGKSYDWRCIVGAELGERAWDAPDSWICSELQMAALKKSGIWNPKGQVHVNKIWPNIAYLIMVSLPGAWQAA